jgi:hypothetical protein
MWIEILLKDDNDNEDNREPSIQLFNTNCIVAIEHTDGGIFCLLAGDADNCFYEFKDIPTRKAIFQAFKMALQGQEVTIEKIGYLKPLLNAQQEQLHKHLLYQQTLNSMAGDVG